MLLLFPDVRTFSGTPAGYETVRPVMEPESVALYRDRNMTYGVYVDFIK